MPQQLLREALRMGIEHLTVLNPTEIGSFDFQVEFTVGQYNTNLMRLRSSLGLHRDVNDAHGAGANLQNKTTLKRMNHATCEKKGDVVPSSSDSMVMNCTDNLSSPSDGHTVHP